jgi:hypothetical protein
VDKVRERCSRLQMTCRGRNLRRLRGVEGIVKKTHGRDCDGALRTPLTGPAG